MELRTQRTRGREENGGQEERGGASVIPCVDLDQNTNPKETWTGSDSPPTMDDARDLASARSKLS